MTPTDLEAAREAAELLREHAGPEAAAALERVIAAAERASTLHLRLADSTTMLREQVLQQIAHNTTVLAEVQS